MSDWINSPVIADSPDSCSTVPKIDLNKVPPVLAASFQSPIVDYLHSANLCDYDVLCCHDIACVSNEHKAQIDSLYFHLCNCLSTATNLHFGQSLLNSKVRKTMERLCSWCEDNS